LKDISGKALRYGDNVNTDLIIPARYLNITDASVLAEHAMEDLDPQFRQKAATYGILVAGKNFGCGSSREHAVLVLKASGIKAILAESYARIFFRNAINQGIPTFEVEGTSDGFGEGDQLELDLKSWTVRNLTKARSSGLRPLPDFMMSILESGGLVSYLKERREW